MKTAVNKTDWLNEEQVGSESMLAVSSSRTLSTAQSTTSTILNRMPVHIAQKELLTDLQICDVLLKVLLVNFYI